MERKQQKAFQLTPAQLSAKSRLAQERKDSKCIKTLELGQRKYRSVQKLPLDSLKTSVKKVKPFGIGCGIVGSAGFDARNLQFESRN